MHTISNSHDYDLGRIDASCEINDLSQIHHLQWETS